MPRALEPGVKRFVVLPYDRAKPEAEQPKFFYAAQNLHKSAKIARLMDETQNAKDSEAVHDSVIRSLQEIITGWENLLDPDSGKPIPFSPDKIPEVLTMADANELIAEVFKSNVVDAEDQKKTRIAALVRNGLLCERCRGGRCAGRPTPEAPLEIACPVCEEAGCENCLGVGTFTVTDCPKRVLDVELVQAVKYAEMFQNGIPLVAGGVMDQSAWFMAFVDLWQYENGLAEAETYRNIRKR